MKTIVTSMLIASLFLGAASCVREDVKHTEEEGEKTSMTLKLSFPKNEDSRATDDPNAIAAEAVVNHVDVFIFGETGTYLSRTTLQTTDFTADATGNGEDTYTANATIPTTTGLKHVLVGINLSEKVAKTMEGQQVGRANTTVQTYSTFMKSTYGDVTVKGLPMFSATDVTATLTANAADNTVEIPVKRIVAKVTVEKATSMQQDGVPGTLGDLTWAINNQNTKFYLIQGAAPQYIDPNWSASQYDDSNFLEAADPADYVAVANGPQAITGYEALYAMENTSDQKTAQELTRVTVRSTFIPTNIVTTYTQGTKTVSETTNTASTPTTFYVVTTSKDIVYFSDPTNARDYATDMSGEMVEYTDGVCYWNIYLNKSGTGDSQWDVLRNDFYKCNITRITAPGNPTAELSSIVAGTTPQDDTSIQVDVNILFWNTPVMDDYVLEP